MPKDVTPPPPAPRYEGYRWLGTKWGRTGNPKPSWMSGTLMVVAAVVVYAMTINSLGNDATTGASIVSALVGTACLLAATFYFIEGHFAARAKREQVPTTPAAPTEPSVGP